MHKIVLLVSSCLMLLATALAAPSAGTAQSVDYPKTRYNVRYGNSYVKGSLIWYNRSVKVSGALKAASGCRDVVYTAFTGGTIRARETRGACNRTRTHGFTMVVNLRGGAKRVYVDLYENGHLRDYAICTRDGCA
ncbi:hypothetical protein [Spongiactinospora rosea]|nr:hypothetical protein [Spongiactinospora rosea]